MAMAASGGNDLLDLFTRDNQDLWPLHVVGYTLGVAAVALILTDSRPPADRAVAGGHLTVGDNFARHALPGVLAGIGIAVLSVFIGATLWIVALISARRRGMEGAQP